MLTTKFSITAFTKGLKGISLKVYKEARQGVENALVEFVMGTTPPVHVEDWKKAKAAVIKFLMEEAGFSQSRAYALQRDAFAPWGAEPKGSTAKQKRDRARYASKTGKGSKTKGADVGALMVKGWSNASVKQRLDFILSLLQKLKRDDVTDGVKARCGKAITDLQVS